MAFVTVPYLIVPPDLPLDTNNGWNQAAVGLSTTFPGRATVWIEPSGGTINQFEFQIRVVSTAQTLRFGIRGMDAVGNPSQTVIGSSQTLNSSNVVEGWHIIRGFNAAVVLGSAYAMVIQYDAVIGSASLAIFTPGATRPAGTNTTYDMSSAGTWVKSLSSYPHGYLEYTGSTPVRVPHILPFNSASVISTIAAGDAAGMEFSLAFSSRVIGIQGAFYNVNNQVFVPYIWSSGGAVISSGNEWDEDVGGQSSGQSGFWPLPATTLSSNTIYKIGIQTTGASMTFNAYTVESSKHLDAVWGGSSGFYYTSRSSGTWSTNTLRYPLCQMVIDQIDIPAGGGGAATVTAAGVWGF